MTLTLTLNHTENGIVSEEKIELADDVVLRLTSAQLFNYLITLHNRMAKSRLEFEQKHFQSETP